MPSRKLQSPRPRLVSAVVTAGILATPAVPAWAIADETTMPPDPPYAQGEPLEIPPLGAVEESPVEATGLTQPADEIAPPVESIPADTVADDTDAPAEDDDPPAEDAAPPEAEEPPAENEAGGGDSASPDGETSSESTGGLQDEIQTGGAASEEDVVDPMVDTSQDGVPTGSPNQAEGVSGGAQTDEAGRPFTDVDTTTPVDAQGSVVPGVPAPASGQAPQGGEPAAGSADPAQVPGFSADPAAGGETPATGGQLTPVVPEQADGPLGAGAPGVPDVLSPPLPKRERPAGIQQRAQSLDAGRPAAERRRPVNEALGQSVPVPATVAPAAEVTDVPATLIPKALEPAVRHVPVSLPSVPAPAVVVAAPQPEIFSQPTPTPFALTPIPALGAGDVAPVPRPTAAKRPGQVPVQRSKSQQRLLQAYTKVPTCLGMLGADEQRVLLLRIGVDGALPSSRQQVAQRLDMPRGRVTRLERNALIRLVTFAAGGGCATTTIVVAGEADSGAAVFGQAPGAPSAGIGAVLAGKTTEGEQETRVAAARAESDGDKAIPVLDQEVIAVLERPAEAAVEVVESINPMVGVGLIGAGLLLASMAMARSRRYSRL